MAQLPNQNQDDLQLGEDFVAITSGAEPDTETPQDTGNSFVKNLQQMLAASSGSAAEFVQRLAQYYDTEASRLGPMVENMTPAEAAKYLQFFNMPFTQTGLEEWLQRTVGSASPEGYSGGMARLDAFLAGQSGLGSLEEQQRKHSALLKSLGLAADPSAQLPPTQGTPPGSGGNTTPPPTQGGGAGYTPPGYTPPPNPFPIGGGGYEPPIPWDPNAGGGYNPYPDYSGGMPGYTPPPTPTFDTYNPYTPSGGNTGGGGGSPAGWTPEGGDVYQRAYQRYQTYGIDALDQYERNLLGLSSGSPGIWGVGAQPPSPTFPSGGEVPWTSPFGGGTGSFNLPGEMYSDPYRRAMERYNTYGIDALDQYERDLLGLSASQPDLSFSWNGGFGQPQPSQNIPRSPENPYDPVYYAQPPQSEWSGSPPTPGTPWSPTPQTSGNSAYDQAYQRYQQWGIDALDQYERDLLGLSGMNQSIQNYVQESAPSWGGTQSQPQGSGNSAYDQAYQRYQTYGVEALDQYERDLLGLNTNWNFQTPRFW